MDNKKLLADLLAQPGKVGPEHVSMLQEMVAQFPYAQPIHLLLAKANASAVPKAALYSQGHVLFHILNMVSVREATEEEKINEVVAENTQDEQVVFEEIGELAPDLHSENPVTPIEIPNRLPGIDSHLMDLPADDDSFIESVAATDFFAFEQKLSTDVVTTVPEIETVVPDEPERNFVSQYNDDKLPYTFLWWLAKTRKEHEQIFQPYARPNAGKVKPQPQNNQQQERAEFQQQYVEHIFHIQTPFEVADHLAEYPSAEIKDAKGAEIIERFLKEDPTIKPPKPEQIDNENKAKKSAEDNYDLVSETLAKIYIEQMLYHKAIDTYKKLSLKYPEKSRYFADLIQSIEKKF
ncbi:MULTISPECIES: hypothetical protein [unclassified Pedobacter]|uniref:hypothetical protein n=1 Tax=unclassified Pedobacter TaxID=2628915 RepID=UPI001D80E98D|nr:MULTISPECIES: hypothetical protein [unclassified Pedobacter]CAH0180439.1 hypothetical protein SRABI36_01496 [Pedobacter sp. Bi36]CAH0236430.1 hypothetical protein SRABI126_02589 [Pedobacter sp. Bi126]